MTKSPSAGFPVWDIPVALALLTRLPLPRLPDAAFARQARAAWAYPVVGLIVGGLAVLAGWLAQGLGLPVAAAAGLVLLVQVAVTGAMHEDGLSDTVDGLWGGHTRERRLEIMRDSRTGSYGILALIFGVGLRWIAVSGLLALAPGAVIAAAVLSRGFMPCVMAALRHARSDGLAHRVGRASWATAGTALLLGLILALAVGGWVVLVPGLIAALAVAALALIARAKIGGQTGDILGATQQVGEIVLLLGLLAMI